jgi:hypothetical protein
MKINVPKFAAELQVTLLSVLKILFAGDPENSTLLWEIFVPRKIETRTRVRRKAYELYQVRMQAPGVYVEAVCEGRDIGGGMKYSTQGFRIKTRRRDEGGGWVEFDLPLSAFLRPEFDSDSLDFRRARFEAIEAVRAKLK